MSNDEVQTPVSLAETCCQWLRPHVGGSILEPCRGAGNFLKAYEKLDQSRITEIHSCEINDGEDFMDWKQKVDWIITNPPWSKMRDFLRHGYEVSDNVVYLVTVNHLWTKARVRDAREAGFGIRGQLLVPMPPEFPSSGFQLGFIWLQRGFKNPHIDHIDDLILSKE